VYLFLLLESWRAVFLCEESADGRENEVDRTKECADKKERHSGTSER
jgi:hypothetical protein